MAAEIPNERLELFISVIEKRKATYGKVIVSLALVKNIQNDWVVGYGLVNFTWKGDPVDAEQLFDYGNFLLLRKIMDVNQAISFLRTLFTKKVIKWDSQEMPINVSVHEPYFFPSGSQRDPAQWPMLFLSPSIDSTTTHQLPHDSLSKLGLPLFPNGTEAVNNFFGLKRYTDWSQLSNQFLVRVPDFRARIKTLRLTGNRVTLEIETRDITQTDLRAKFYCKTEDMVYLSNDLQIENGQATYTAEQEPLIVEAHLLSVVDGDILDRRNYDYRYPQKEKGVEIENKDEQLLDIIAKGENRNVEFKLTIDPKNENEFLESVVAFANTSGGTIFLGVDDNCRVKDFREDAKARIADLIHGNCDPQIEVQVRQVTLGEHQISIVEVSEGTNKPYILNNRGIFVRRGSSDRPIKRSELDEIYTNRKQGNLTSRYY